MDYSIYIENQKDRPAAELFRRLMDLWHYTKVIITDSPQNQNADIILKRDASLPAEGFRLVCDNGNATVFGSCTRGVTYGISELLKHIGKNNIDITESPFLPIRGTHFYLPAQESVEGFKRIIDMLALLRYNTIIIEVAGGMEYKNHPEINEGWIAHCDRINNYPGSNSDYQSTYPFYKNSTHTELAGGSFLSQDTVRSIVDHAKGYGIDVVPELQFISHSYHIVASHPELAERVNDFNHDTLCPRNEGSYKLYFEMAEEVLDVFKPKRVSVGMDV